MSKLTSDQIDKICTLYESGQTMQSLADDFGVYVAAIRYRLQQRGISSRPSSLPKYKHNSEYFSKIDTEQKAYWLGFIAADGCISGRDYTCLIVRLSTKDIDHLYMLRKALESDHPIHERNTDGYNYCSLEIHSDKLVQDLSKYSVVPRKSATVSWPSIKENLLRHYLRGYFDGDGWFSRIFHKSGSRTGNKIQPIFGVIGNLSFLTECRRYLIDQCQVNENHLRSVGKSFAYQITWCGSIQVLRICNLMYQDATVYFDRKRDKMLTYYRSRGIEPDWA